MPDDRRASPGRPGRKPGPGRPFPCSNRGPEPPARAAPIRVVNVRQERSMFRLSKWLSRSYRRAIEANIRRTRRSDLSIGPRPEVGPVGKRRSFFDIRFDGTGDSHFREPKGCFGGFRLPDPRAKDFATLWSGTCQVGKVVLLRRDWSRSGDRSGLRIRTVFGRLFSATSCPAARARTRLHETRSGRWGS